MPSESYPESASQLLGRTIDNGALRIEAILGAGSFGVVYRAVDTRTGAQYAVKCVEKHESDYQARERRLHARVSSHPHVLTFHCEINTDRYVFFVYDLCAGTLHSVIKKLTFFREDELIKRIFIQIIDAVEYCHSRGVYHRDLKPENILVSAESEDMDVFLADFSLATTSQTTESPCGTPCFMIPAESHHMPYSNVQGDIWALGCILAEMISNIRLWEKIPPDSSYGDYIGNRHIDYIMNRRVDYILHRHVLFDILPISYSAYVLLRDIFSTISVPKLRPSLADIRKEVMEIDTFFITEQQATHSRRWRGWPERTMEQKIKACEENVDAFCRSSETRYSCGSSSSGGRAFESSSAERRDVPLLPPALSVEGMGMGKNFSRLKLPQPLRRFFKRSAFKLK
ncbi:kinase-like domain-containing protein [Lactifluus volemus]|nr:kinase-like domain-containing protein [Lactifluus volemus]